jgi:pyruvate-ferredoxin/flavodoxin oxidoreductase
MRIGKSKSKKKEIRFPGYPHALDGHAAAYAVETTVGEAVVVQSGPDMAELTGPLRNLAPAGYDPIAGRAPVVRHVDELRPLVAQAAGYAATGLRTGALVTGLSGVRDALYAAAGKRLTCVLNLTCRAVRRQAGSLHGGHEDYYAAAGSGVFQLFARNAQEVADFTLIAHRVAELSLTPGVCAQDFYQTSQSVQNVLLPEHDLVEVFLGRPGDTIESPTPAQTIAFGGRRRRVPALVDPDRPAGVGGVQDGDAYYKAVTGQHPFYSFHLESLLEAALREFGELTGRKYGRVSGYRVEDADYVVLTQGAVVEALESVVDHLRETGKLKVGVINLSVLRPFPGGAITKMLKGKKAATILERTDQSLAEDLPLVKEVRAAIDKAAENATGDGGPIHEGHETYRRPADRPRIYAGIYGVGGALPAFGDLAAVYENMAAGANGKTDTKSKPRFYVGARFNRPARRFPHLQTLQQRLRRDYPEVDDMTLTAEATAPAPRSEAGSMTIHSLSVQGAVFAGNLFAQTMADSLDRYVRTFPSGGLDPGLQPACFTLSFSKDGPTDSIRPEIVDTAMVSGDKLIETVSSRSSIEKGGTIIVGSNRGPDALWQGLSRRTRRWIREFEARVYVVDVARIASEAASKPSFADQLSVWALLGAGLGLDARTGEDDFDNFKETLRLRLEQLLGKKHYLVDDITAVFAMGADETAELDWRSLPADETAESEEPEAPWTVKRLEAGGESTVCDDSVFDPARFWRSVGFLYDSGEQLETLIDPYVATGIVPGGSSAYRDMTPYRLGVPRWLPENCTGCGLCWAHCPDSALPATIQPISAAIKHAMTTCEKDGAAMVQMQRVADHLAKQAYKVAGKDDLCLHRTMGELLGDAFSQLVEKMNLAEDKLQPLQSEFDQVRARCEDYPVARTQCFFDDVHIKEKGSGRLLSIALNPLSCKGCGLCLSVCPENALEWVEQTDELLDTARHNWDWHMSLPTVPKETIDAHVVPDDPDTEVHRLLDKHAYHSIVGGDAAPPGTSVKTAAHLVTAAIESVMRPRFDKHIERLDSLIQRMEDRIQGKVSKAVEINDFESFGRELDRLGKDTLTPERLAKLTGEKSERQVVDPDQLKRLNDLLTSLIEQRQKYTEGAGRARMVMTIDPGGAAFWSGTYPDNPHNHPWVCHLPGDAPALAEGVFEGVSRSLAEEFKACRLVELELEDMYTPAEHDPFFRRFDRRDFTSEERDLVPPILVLGHTGVTAWDDIFRLLARRYPVKIVVINTGAIPVDVTVAKDTDEKTVTIDKPSESSKNNDPGLLALGRRGVYVLQSTTGHPGHLIRGVVRGLTRPHPALFHVHAPDPQASGIAPEKVAEQAKLAYVSRAFPLFEADPETPGALVTLDDNPDFAEEHTTRELVFVDASDREETITAPVTVADWAIGEARFQEHFTVYSKGHFSDQMKSLAEYIRLDPDQRQAYEPFIHVRDDRKRQLVAVISQEMVRAEEERQRYWKYLRELASGVGAPAVAALAEQPAEPAPAETPAAQPEPMPAPGPELDQALHAKLTDKLMWLSGYSQDPDFFKQSLRDYLVRKREGGAGAADTETNTTAE